MMLSYFWFVLVCDQETCVYTSRKNIGNLLLCEIISLQAQGGGILEANWENNPLQILRTVLC